MLFKNVVSLAAFVALQYCPPANAQQVKFDQRLIAHRGGVVNEELGEHSLAGLQAAIDRGYWMVEIDVRETKDGLPIVHHDRDFQRYYNRPQSVAEMTWEEIRHLRSTAGDHRPLLLSEFAAACRGKMKVMIEIKGPTHDEKYYKVLEHILRENDLLDGAYMIGIPEAKQFFRGKLRTSVQRDDFDKALAAGEEVASLYFLFQGARHLDEKTIEIARKSGIPIVAAINRHHYRGEDSRQRAYDDIQRMKDLGIEMFQIDSVYDRWFVK